MDNFDYDSTADALPDGKSGRWGKHPVSKGARIYGIVMVIAALIWLFLSIDIWKNEFERMNLMTTYTDPQLAFVNPQELTGGLALIGTLQGFAAIVLCLGIYRIIFSRKSTILVFIVFPLAFAAIIGQALYVNSVRVGIHETVLSNQHTWAEQRYGIVYDEITLRKVNNSPTGKESRSYEVQDSVMKDGEIVATVCERHERQSTLFCEPGTDTELFPVVSSSEYDYSDETLEEDDPYDYSPDEDFVVSDEDPPAGDIGIGY